MFINNFRCMINIEDIIIIISIMGVLIVDSQD